MLVPWYEYRIILNSIQPASIQLWLLESVHQISFQPGVPSLVVRMTMSVVNNPHKVVVSCQQQMPHSYSYMYQHSIKMFVRTMKRHAETQTWYKECMTGLHANLSTIQGLHAVQSRTFYKSKTILLCLVKVQLPRFCRAACLYARIKPLNVSVGRRSDLKSYTWALKARQFSLTAHPLMPPVYPVLNVGNHLYHVAAVVAEEQKHVKYEVLYDAEAYCFYPVAIETSGR